MRWDDKVYSGTYEKWFWGVSLEEILAVERLVVTFADHYLCVPFFDGGAIYLSPEDQAEGWLSIGNALVSPRLSSELEISHDTYDEWYIFEKPPKVFPKVERFVNYGGFNLADPRQMSESFDRTWERSGLDWLYPIQERFWAQLETIDPVAYIGVGEFSGRDVVVSTNADFVYEFLTEARGL